MPHYNPNLINGQLPQWGNPDHIAYVKNMSALFSGEKSFHTIEWSFCNYWGKHTDTGKPKFRWAEQHKDADAVVDYVPCPKCKRDHVLLVGYDPQANWYDMLIAIDDSVKEFECWNCKTEFVTDEDRNVFVKQKTE